jgi:two-component system alkaline phosphatase synthesis response regulator PhoP
MAHEKIMVVEDEADIQELIRYNLAKEGFLVTTCDSGEDALERVNQHVPDLVLLDLMLPGISGLDVCRALRRAPQTQSVPIIMLTAKSEEADIVTGLELGADDYVTKPFSPRVLLARVQALLRRRVATDEPPSTTIRRGDIEIDTARHQVTLAGAPLDLTYTEFGVLELLARRAGIVFTRYQIVDAVKGEDYPVTDRSVDVQIVGLRKKLGNHSKLIETVRGVGYRFRAD